MTTKKQGSTRLKKIQKAMLEIRNEFWPELKEDDIWHRPDNKGYTSIPRTMPHIMNIIDALSPKGKPASSTYFALWCRAFDESMIRIDNAQYFASEAGFSGQRLEATWLARMHVLKDLGFISSQEGPTGLFHYTLIYNPNKIIEKLWKEKHPERSIPGALYTAYFERTKEVWGGKKDEDDDD